MKRISFFLLFTISCLGFASCKKDAVKPKPVVLDIAGNWKLTSLSSEYIFGDQTVTRIDNQPISDYVDHIYFKADGTGTMSVNGVALRKFTYTATDSIIHVSNFRDIASNEVFGTGAFVSYITKLSSTNLEMTDMVYSYGVTFYKNDRYDQVQRHIGLVKEK